MSKKKRRNRARIMDGGQICVRLDDDARRNLERCCKLWHCSTSKALRHILTDIFAKRARRPKVEEPPVERAPAPAFFTEKELAIALHTTRITLSRLRRKGMLPHIKLGRAIRYPREEFLTWLRALRAKCPRRGLSVSGGLVLWQRLPKAPNRVRRRLG